MLRLLMVYSLLTPASGWGAKFANQFVEFELPAKWACRLEGSEWVCESSDQEKKRDAIVILAAKLRGDQDSLDQYYAYLTQAKNYNSVDGKSVKSEPKYTKNAQINEHPWVDSLHLESEVPGYYTRYLATIKNDIGVLVTYAINKDKYQAYLAEFENMVKTLKVFRKPGGINAASKDSNLFSQAKIPQHIGQSTVFPGVDLGGDDGTAKKRKKQDLPIIPIAIGIAIILFIIWKKKRGSG